MSAPSFHTSSKSFYKAQYGFVDLFICSIWSSQLISATTSMFQTSAQHAFAISVNCDTSGAYCLQSATTLVHAFMTSRIDYCNVVFVAALKSVTSKLQRVLNAAAGVVSGTRKFDRGLTQLLHADLHWIDVPERVKYQLCTMMCRCQDGTAPQYLTAHWAPVSETAS